MVCGYDFAGEETTVLWGIIRHVDPPVLGDTGLRPFLRKATASRVLTQEFSRAQPSSEPFLWSDGVALLLLRQAEVSAHCCQSKKTELAFTLLIRGRVSISVIAKPQHALR